jgi:hypothetical protein
VQNKNGGSKLCFAKKYRGTIKFVLNEHINLDKHYFVHILCSEMQKWFTCCTKIQILGTHLNGTYGKLKYTYI